MDLKLQIYRKSTSTTWKDYNIVQKILSQKYLQEMLLMYRCYHEEGSIGRRAIAAVKAVKRCYIVALGKILRAIVKSYIVAHDLLKINITNYKYKRNTKV